MHIIDIVRILEDICNHFPCYEIAQELWQEPSYDVRDLIGQYHEDYLKLHIDVGSNIAYYHFMQIIRIFRVELYINNVIERKKIFFIEVFEYLLIYLMRRTVQDM